MPTLWALVLVGNALVAWDWYSQTEQGQAFMAAAQAKLKGCVGCARRREALKAKINRVHWDATQIVEGRDVETVPEP